MKSPRQSFGHGPTGEPTGPGEAESPQVHDGEREMNTLHSISTSAVITRLHDVHRSGSEKSGAVSGRGCARGSGRQHPAYMSVVDAHTGETHGGTAYREDSGEQRRSLTEAEFTA